MTIGSAVGLYACVMIAIGILAGRRVESEEDYLVAGRHLPLWLAWGTLLATWFGAGTMLGASDAAREEGLRGVILDPFASGLALIIAGLFFAHRMWDMRLLTMGDFYARTYGPRTERLSSIVQAVGYFPWIAAQYVALAAVLQEAFGWPTPIGITVAALFVLYLTISGGMWSVTMTDTAQVFVVLVGLVILGLSVFGNLGDGSVTAGVQRVWRDSDPESRTMLPEAGGLAMMAWMTTWMNGALGNIPGQDLMQRVFSARSARTARQACLLAGVMYLGFGLVPVLLGLGSRLVLPEADSDGILIALARVTFTPALRIVFVVSLLSIVVSTATSALLSPSALLAHNVLHHFKVFHDRPLLVDRGTVLCSTLLALPFAFASPDVLGLLEEALAIGLVALLVPFFTGFFGRPRGDLSGVLAVLLGGGVWLGHRLLGWILLPDELPAGPLTPAHLLWQTPSELFGVAASTVGYFLGQRLLPPTSDLAETPS